MDLLNENDHTILSWQTPADEIDKPDWDCIVIGAGPAGSMAARKLAGSGHEVLLLDRQHFPRDKACGDCLIADAIICLKENGLYPHIKEHSNVIATADIYSPSRHRFDVPGEYLAIPRVRFDTLLARAAVDAGAQFACGEVREIKYDQEKTVKISVDGLSKPLSTRTCLITTGGQILLARKLLLVGDTTPYAFAMRCYVRSAFELDRLILTYDRPILPGYGWIIPLGQGLYNVGCGTAYRGSKRLSQDLKAVFHSLISDFPPGRELMEAGKQSTPLRGAPLRCNLVGARPYDGCRILLAGEVIGATYPFTGEGIGKAMQTGEIAAEILAEALTESDMDLLKQYPTRLESAIKPLYKSHLAAERCAAHPWTCDFLAKRIGRSKYLHDKFAGFVARDGGSHIVKGAWRVIQSYWK